MNLATMKALDKADSKPELGMLFVLLVGLSVAVTSFLPRAFFEFWRQLVLWHTRVIGGLLGQEVVSRADVLTVNGFAMQVVDECTALNYAIILATAILLYRRHTIGYRLTGVLIAIPAIVVVNALRLVMTGITGSLSRKWFDFVHEYLWVALFALLIFALWKLWADRSLKISGKAVRRTALVLVGCSALFGLLIAMMPFYGPLLAFLSSFIVKIFLGDARAAISWAGSTLQCSYATTSYRVPFSLEFFNVSVLAGLVLPLQKKGDRKTLALSLFCLVSALLLNAMLIANSFYIMVRHGQSAFNAFLFIEKGLLLSVPFALWWVIANGTENTASAVEP